MISGWRPSDPINFLPPPEGGGNNRYEDTLSRHISTLNLHLEPADNLRLASLCGPFDDNLKQLERRLGIEISYRDNHFQVLGKQAQIDAAAVILKHLYVETQPLRGGKVNDITPEMVHLTVQESRVLEQDDEAPNQPYGKEVTVKTKRGLIKPRSPNQAQYIANIVRHDISFGIGPAGTGKTYLAVAAAVILKHLYVETQPLKGGKVTDITPDMVHLAIQESRVLEQDDEPAPNIPYGKEVTVKTKRGLIKPRSPNQAQYIANIVRHDISFGIGPAGTGKTYLAVAAAVDALERQEIRRILLTRPAVEAGEKLGFLPGDLSQKVDPYLRPLYDALFEMLGFERVEKLMERNIIEVAPLAYMRGRTLNDAFIILDEAQNTTTEQMKMFLTRIGFNSKAVVTGDITQVDLPRSTKSGLRHALEVLQGVDGLSFNFFESKDVVRHPVVARIVQAYEAFDAQQAAEKSASNTRNENTSKESAQ